MTYRPTRQDCFWTPQHGSGVVHRIDWEDRIVKVEYYDGYITGYTFDELDYCKKLYGFGELYAPDR